MSSPTRCLSRAPHNSSASRASAKTPGLMRRRLIASGRLSPALSVDFYAKWRQDRERERTEQCHRRYKLTRGLDEQCVIFRSVFCESSFERLDNVYVGHFESYTSVNITFLYCGIRQSSFTQNKCKFSISIIHEEYFIRFTHRKYDHRKKKAKHSSSQPRTQPCHPTKALHICTHSILYTSRACALPYRIVR